MSLIYIALGGGLGAVSRFLLTEHINNISDVFPFGTLFVNILGCFVIGCIAGYFASKSSPMYLFFVFSYRRPKINKNDKKIDNLTKIY